MINLDNISNIGIGTYRMSVENNTHKTALEYAIKNGINLIDTASNYQQGKSEILIGEVIKPHFREQIFITTKAGYIQGKDINKISLINKDMVIKINDNFYYSIDNQFIQLQIEQSLKRMKSEYIDCFLIHNPEHYFDIYNNLQKDIDQHIINTFLFLEELVKSGIIRYYGISSNNLPNPTLLNFQIENLIKMKTQFPHFKMIQFPYNLVESGASSNLYGDKSLIDLCKKNKIKCISNRPFNTFYQGKTLKLIDYNIDINESDQRKELDLFESFLNSIQKRLNELEDNTPLEEFLVIKYLINCRKEIGDKDALNKIIENYLLPFINQIDLVNEKTLTLINLLKNQWDLFIKYNNNVRLINLKQEMGINEKEEFMKYLYNHYQNKGIDHIMMGLRDKKYFEAISKFIN